MSLSALNFRILESVNNNTLIIKFNSECEVGARINEYCFFLKSQWLRINFE
jgi:hypothetical protein